MYAMLTLGAFKLHICVYLIVYVTLGNVIGSHVYHNYQMHQIWICEYSVYTNEICIMVME